MTYIIGDVHGEFGSLLQLVKKLPNDANLIFVGDLVDRGPDSPGVVFFVKKLIDNGNAQMVLGNHELNVLQHKAKHGSGWYFDEQVDKDKDYQPFNRTDDEERSKIYEFLSGLPIALENDELRIVHAAWVSEKINEIRNIPLGDVGKIYIKLEKEINNSIKTSGLLENYYLEQDEWIEEIEDPFAEKLPFLDYTCNYNLAHQMNNPLRVLSSGVEKRAEEQFFASGKWRFVQRDNWWNNYEEDIPVIVGHFWRKLNPEIKSTGENVFEGIEANAWHGKKKNVFCVDYSVGARFLERKNNEPIGSNTNLGALSWPEKKLHFENGSTLETTSFLDCENEINIKKQTKYK